MTYNATYKSTLAELQFLPSVYYLSSVTLHGNLILEQWENYNKGSFRNKCLINSNQKNQYFIIPLKKGKHRSQPIREVEISYDENWIRSMLNRLQTEYGSLPYYPYYIGALTNIFEENYTYIFDLNKRLMQLIFDLCGLCQFSLSESFALNPRSEILDLRDQISPGFVRENSSLLGATDLGYFTFVPGHSIIEALFSYGPETEILIRQYQEHLCGKRKETKD